MQCSSPSLGNLPIICHNSLPGRSSLTFPCFNMIPLMTFLAFPFYQSLPFHWAVLSSPCTGRIACLVPSGLGWLLRGGYPTPGLSSLRAPKRLRSCSAKKPHSLPLIICTERPHTLKLWDVFTKTNVFRLFIFYLVCLSLEWFSIFYLFSKT